MPPFVDLHIFYILFTNILKPTLNILLLLCFKRSLNSVHFFSYIQISLWDFLSALKSISNLFALQVSLSQILSVFFFLWNYIYNSFTFWRIFFIVWGNLINSLLWPMKHCLRACIVLIKKSIIFLIFCS